MFCMINKQFCVLFSFVLLGFSYIAKADLINITDPSLESGLSGTNGTPESGWFSFGGITTSVGVGPGTFWGSGAGMTNADGPNAAYAVHFGENDGGNLYQTVQLDAGITYSLTAAIGMSSSSAKSDGKFRIGFYTAGFGGGNQLEGSIATRGDFNDYSVLFTPSTTANYQIGVRSIGYVPGTGADNDQSTIFFDNVRLVAIPEPGSFAVIAGSLAGAILLTRRSRRS